MFAQQINNNFLGINLDQPVYFSKLRVYEDWGENTSFFHTSGNGAVVDLDTGFPSSGNTSQTIFHEVGDVWEAGDYTLSWGGAGTGPTSKTLNPGDNSENYNFTGDISGFSFIKNGVTQKYTDEFQALARTSNILRFMDVWRTNFAYFDQSNPWVRITDQANTFYHKLLTPQKLVEISQDFKCHIWVNMHVKSDSTHWNEVANVLKDCWGDVIIEYGNETWNASLVSYQQLALEYSGLGYTGGEYSSVNALALDRTESMASEFKSVDPDKFIAVWNGQFRNTFSWTGATNEAQTSFENVDGICIAPYVSGPDFRGMTPSGILALTPEEVVDVARDDWRNYVVGGTNQMGAWQDIANASGMRLMCYEAGSHSENGDTEADDYLISVVNSSTWVPFEYEMLRWFNTNFKDYVCVYRDSGDDVWGYRQKPLHIGNTPRYQSWGLCAGNRSI